jgi:voltage-dependent calcium channel
MELVTRIIVSGYILNSVEYSTLDSSLSLKAELVERSKDRFTPYELPMEVLASSPIHKQAPSVSRTFMDMQPSIDISNNPRRNQCVQLAHRAFLRHSFNRLDFLAVISY